jgi:hypothetical protein
MLEFTGYTEIKSFDYLFKYIYKKYDFISEKFFLGN